MTADIRYGYLLPIPAWVRPLLLLTLLAAAVARWHQSGEESLWLDEILQATIAQGMPSDLISRLSQQAAAPADYVVSAALLVLGRQEFWLRFPATLFSLLTLPVLFLLGRASLGWLAALAAVMLLAVSPYAVHYAQELRPYAAFGFWSVLASTLLLHALKRDEGRLWLAFAAASFINLHTHLFALAVLAVHGAWLAILALGSLLLRRRALPREAWAWRWPGRRWLWALAVLVALVGVALFSPWLPDYVAAVAGRFLGTVSPANIIGNAGAGQVVPQAGGLQQLDLALVRGTVATMSAGLSQPANWLYLALAVLGGALSLRRRPATTLLLLMLIVAGPLLVLLLLMTRQARFNPRYLIFAHPIYLLLVGGGLAGLGRGAHWLLRQRLPARRTLVEPAVTLALGLVLAAGTLPGLVAFYAEEREDWRGVAAFLAQAVQPADAFAAPNALARYVAFYWPGILDYRRPANTPEKIMGLQDSRIWLLATPYNRAAVNPAVQAWLVVNKAAALSFPPNFTLYYLHRGRDGLAELAEWAENAQLTDDPAWRVRLADAFGARVKVALEAGDADGAAWALEKQLVYADGDAWADFLHAGDLYRQAGDPAAALPLYEAAVQLAPDRADARNALGWAYLQAGRPADAEAQFRSAIQSDPGTFWGHYLLGDALRVQEQDENALAAYQAAQAIDPTSPLPYRRLGDLYRRLGEVAAAVAAYRQGLVIAPDDVAQLRGLALALESQEDLATAREAWQRYLDLAPEGPFAAEARSHLERLDGGG